MERIEVQSSDGGSGLVASLKRLRAAKDSRLISVGQRFPRSLLLRADAELDLPMPESWRTLVTKLGDGARVGDIELLTLARIDNLQDQIDSLRLQDPKLPRRVVLLGEDGCGDSFLLKVGKAGAADAPLLRFCHERGRVSETWPSIEAYVAELASRI
jgi:hypothetical protein